MPYGEDPANDPTDEARLLVGDTDADDPLLTDSEWEYYMDQAGDVPKKAAYLVARVLQARYSKKLSKSIGRTRIEYSDLVRQFSDLATTLAEDGGRDDSIKVGPPLAGGMTNSLKLGGTWGPTDDWVD